MYVVCFPFAESWIFLSGERLQGIASPIQPGIITELKPTPMNEVCVLSVGGGKHSTYHFIMNPSSWFGQENEFGGTYLIH